MQGCRHASCTPMCHLARATGCWLPASPARRPRAAAAGRATPALGSTEPCWAAASDGCCCAAGLPACHGVMCKNRQAMQCKGRSKVFDRSGPMCLRFDQNLSDVMARREWHSCEAPPRSVPEDVLRMARRVTAHADRTRRFLLVYNEPDMRQRGRTSSGCLSCGLTGLICNLTPANDRANGFDVVR